MSILSTACERVSELETEVTALQDQNARLKEALEYVMPPLLNENFPGSTELKKARDIFLLFQREAKH